MTVTLVRPAPVQVPGFGPVALVRVRPAPAIDPPYDDEPPVPFDGGQPPPPVEPQPASPGPSPDPSPGPSPVPSPTREPGEAHRVVRRYLDVCLEVLGGFRPLAHLRPLTEAGRFDEVAGQLTRLGRVGGSAVTRPGSGPARVTADRPRLRHLRVCEIRAGVVEAAAVLGRGELVRALTLRLEQRDGAWLCTHFEVL